MTTMLYRCPGPHEIHGGRFDYVIVEDDQVDATLADGWHLTTPEAKAAHEAEQAEAARVAAEKVAAAASPAKADSDTPPTRAELEQKATELGISFDGRVGDKKLAERIAEKLKG